MHQICIPEQTSLKEYVESKKIRDPSTQTNKSRIEIMKIIETLHYWKILRIVTTSGKKFCENYNLH